MLTELQGNPLFDLWQSFGFVYELGGWHLPLPQSGTASAKSDPENALVSYGAKSMKWALSRESATRKYSWAIPSPEAIAWIVKRAPSLVEIGAGRGYWAKLLSDAGAEVAAYDQSITRYGMANNPWHNRDEQEKDRTLYFPVQYGGPKQVAKHQTRTLMLCWPPYHEAMAADCLKEYHGNKLLYIGEDAGGCNGDDEFWGIIEEKWKCVDEFRIPQWPCLHDCVSLYRSK